MSFTPKKAVNAFLKTAGAAVVALCALANAPVAAQTACTAPSSWFTGQPVPMPDPATFPANAGNCDFHLWSWQMFLWLTEPVGPTNAPRFETFAGPETLYPATAGTTASPGALIPGLKLTGTKALNEYLQAGPDGILVDQNGRIVYYSMYIDDVFAKFFADNNLSTSANILALDPDKPFPLGSLSLKAAWRIVQPNEDVSNVYSRKAKINPLTTQGGKFVIDPTKTEDVTVALVGFHIAGTVANHAEMIWASFEHNANAPDVTNFQTAKPNDVVSDKNWTFYKAGTQFKDCNFNPAGSPDQKLDEATQKMSPVTQVCRLYPYGSGSDKQANADNIKSLNASVQSQLKTVWKNYFELGSTWFNTNKSDGGGEPLQPDCNFQPGSLRCGVVITGSTHLSNSVIETFTQSQSTIDSCFSCHHTLQRFPSDPKLNPLPGKDANVSHIFDNLYFRLQQQGK